MTPYNLPSPEVWIYEDKSGGYYINNEQLSEVKFSSKKEREKWLNNFPDIIRHEGKPPVEEWRRQDKTIST